MEKLIEKQGCVRGTGIYYLQVVKAIGIMRSLLEKIEKKQEASYLGNLGAVEMMQFYRAASRQDV